MKRHLGTFGVLLLSLVTAQVGAVLPCMDMLEASHNGRVILPVKDCSQRVNLADLQTPPDVKYGGYLPADHKYILILFENKNDTDSKRLHWLLSDIVAKNHSLTSNGTTIASYKPPANKKSSNYTFQLYKYPQNYDLRLGPVSRLEMEDFLPDRWAEPFNMIVDLHHSRSFEVIGSNETHITTTTSRTTTTDRPESTTATTARPTTPTPDPHHGSSTHSPSAASNTHFGLAVFIIPILSLTVKSALF